MDSRGIMRVLGKLGVEGAARGDRNVYCRCPLAKWTHKNGVDSNPSMSIKVDPLGVSLVQCWSTRCDWTGTLVGLVKYLNHLEQGKFDEVVDLAESLERTDLKARIDATLNGVPDDEDEKLFDESVLEPYRGKIPRYALDRGLTLDLCRDWGLGYDRGHSRLTVPVRNIDGGLVGLLGRAVWPDQKPPWYAYWNFHKGNYLYGEHQVVPASGRVIIVEGVFDVHRGYLHGFSNVVGLMGSRLTDRQAKKLRDWNCEVVWFLDGDDSGRAGAAKGVCKLRGSVPQRVAECPLAKDPDQLDKTRFEAAIASSVFQL